MNSRIKLKATKEREQSWPTSWKRKKMKISKKTRNLTKKLKAKMMKSLRKK
jgi:hypothetical protein